jgi:predicted porin
MKFKTTAIAMAVAGIVAAPMAVQAGADELYASARVGALFEDTGGTADTDIKSMASRFGAKGETDLGNGLIGFGRYEWGVDFNDGGSISKRHRFVGLKGDWGSVKLGQTYQTFYSFVVGPGDNPWWNSGVAQVAYVGRTDKAITYSGGSGSFAFGATAYMSRDTDEETIDVYEAGASFTFGNDMTLAGALQGTNGDEDGINTKGTLIGNGMDKTVVGAMLSGIMLGDVSMAFGGQSQDDDYSFLADIGFNGFYVHLETEHLDEADQDPVMGVLGYTRSLGRKTTMWFEAAIGDADSDNSNDDYTQIIATLKYDII